MTVGRRLAVVVVFSIVAASAVVLLALTAQGNSARNLAIESVSSVAASTDVVISADLESASRRLEILATTVTNADQPDSDAVSRAGFFAAEVVSSNNDSLLDASTNFLERARTNTVLGPTQALDGTVTILIATPVELDTNSTAPTLAVLVGAYDASDLIENVATVGESSSTDVLLAVRNTQSNIVLFDPQNFDSSAEQSEIIGSEIRDLIDNVLSGEGGVSSTGVEIDDVESVVSLRRIDGTEWVTIASVPAGEVGASGPPAWLVPAFVTVALISFIPIAILRRRLDRVVTGAQELYEDRLRVPLTDDSDDEIGILSRSLQSLDDRLQEEAELRSTSAATLQHRATHDPLTGLANRAPLVDKLKETLNKREPAALIFCDIDDFKGINDSQGHEAGDTVLKFVASQLASAVPPSNLIARFGGDEFCVLVQGEPEEARELAAKVERALDATVAVNDVSLRIGGSVGIAIAKRTDTPDSLLRNADLAMYREKERRRGLRRSASSAAHLELSPDQIRLVYQPVVSIVDESIVGVEVLARYMHPVLGMMDPSTFLPPGTEQSEFDNFDLVIMSRSIAQLSEWLSRGVVNETFTMSFNLAPDHVSDPASHREIFDSLRQNRVPPTMLQIEVTEQRLHAHEDDLMNSLHTLRSKGIRIAIDDFGVEGSNVDRLVLMPSDTVKIDKSFVSEIDVDPRAEARLKAILDIVAAEDRVAIAEGVERPAQAEILKKLKVPLGQGYLWQAPLSSVALTPLLGKASRWTRRKPPPSKVK